MPCLSWEHICVFHIRNTVVDHSGPMIVANCIQLLITQLFFSGQVFLSDEFLRYCRRNFYVTSQLQGPTLLAFLFYFNFILFYFISITALPKTPLLPV